MPRGGRSSGGFRSGGSSRSSSRTSSTSPPPRATPQHQTPTAPPRTGGMGGGLMGTLAQGMAFGAGSEVAHQAIRSVTGGGSHAPQQQQTQAPVEQSQNAGGYSGQNMCQNENSNFVECLKFNNNEIARCQDQFNAVQNCQKNM